MFGAIWGDIIGCPYEFNANNYKAKDFPLLCSRSHFTDDSVMTLAVADALMASAPEEEEDVIRARLVHVMQQIGRRYPDSGYGGNFYKWVFSNTPKPYGSFGNGSAMRVSAAAWLYDDLDTVQKMARLTAEVTHNHPEGIKGAQAVATAIFMARTGCSKQEIRQSAAQQFGYDLSRTCDQIRPSYRMNETCQGSVPEAITAFLESTGFEDAIRTAVSLGGDSDTIGAITGSIAEGFYGLPEGWDETLYHHLTPDLAAILRRFSDRIHR